MQQAKTNIYSFLLYLLGFLLFWEWLRPLTVITNTENISLFVSFAAFSFFLSYLQFPFWITFPIKTIAVLYAVHVLFFFNSSILNPLWINYLIRDLKINMTFLFNGNWDGLSNIFRSLLFFILLWIVSYLMHYWLIQTRKLFLFFFVTVIYLSVLDTFTMYHAEAAIVRTMIIGLVLLGLLRVMKVQETEKVIFDKGKLPIQWVLALVFMIVFTSAIGYAAPKTGPHWPDPVPFITKAQNGYGEPGTGNGSGNGLQKIGYDNDDSHLGGAFMNDNTTVFTSYSKDSNYWRIETKDFYTGKGWVNNGTGQTEQVDPNNLQKYQPLKLYGPDTKTKVETAKIVMALHQFPQLLYGGELIKINGASGDLVLNDSNGKLEAEKAGRHVTLNNYSMSYKYPTFDVTKLQQDTGSYPKAIADEYLQLPSELPKRVKDLAANITKDKTNRYDKAKAIENYFKNNGFVYDTKNVAKPTGNQDYVDQFLFDTKQGYCDNFSSSMVVMLRSVGIPARWVKGFTQGDYKDTLNNGDSEFVVKNSNAHSWVEAYFPNSGWVPFEPTISFTNLADFKYKDTATSTPATAKPQKPKQQNKTPKLDPSTNHHDHHAWINAIFSKRTGYILIGFIMLLIIAGLIAYRNRKKWLPKYLLYRFRHRKDEHAFDDALSRLFWILDIFGLKNRPGETMREYAVSIDRKLGTVEMKKLVRLYEKNRYAKHSADLDHWLKSKELWENIIKSLRA